MTGGLRVLLYYASDETDRIEAAYHESSRVLAGTPGLLGNELLRSVHDPAGFVVASSWQSREAFDVWELGSDHKGQTSPLRPFRDIRMPRPFGVYQVTANY
jgi:heme oxygenase (mycobilin-producing)